jgi:dGTPase
MLEGLAKHNGPVAQPGWAMTEADKAFGLELDSWPSLEAQVAAIADDIAYDNHDIDDGLRAGILDIDDLISVPLVNRHWRAINQRHPSLPLERRQRALVRDQIGTMVGDVLEETARRATAAGVNSIEDVRAAGQLVGFSAQVSSEEKALKRFLRQKLYDAPELRPVRVEAQRIVANLARCYRGDPALLPRNWRVAGGGTQHCRQVGDFIAGMTDRFAIARHLELIGPVDMPDRF